MPHPSALLLEFNFTSAAVVHLSHRVNNESQESPTHQGTNLLIRETQATPSQVSQHWKFFVDSANEQRASLPITPPPSHPTISKPETVHACPSALVQGYPGQHLHHGHGKWEVLILRLGHRKTSLCFPHRCLNFFMGFIDPGQQWKRQTLNLFTPSGSSSRFSREAAHLAVLLGFCWLLLELPSLPWMSAKQGSDWVCGPKIPSRKNICK